MLYLISSFYKTMPGKRSRSETSCSNSSNSSSLSEDSSESSVASQAIACCDVLESFLKDLTAVYGDKEVSSSLLHWIEENLSEDEPLPEPSLSVPVSEVSPQTPEV